MIRTSLVQSHNMAAVIVARLREIAIILAMVEVTGPDNRQRYQRFTRNSDCFALCVEDVGRASEGQRQEPAAAEVNRNDQRIVRCWSAQTEVGR